jgi:hypothetical protein
MTNWCLLSVANEEIIIIITVLDKPRMASIVGGGLRLPSARVVTQIVHPTYSRDDRINTHMIMQWGQFLDHDITLTPNSNLANAAGKTQFFFIVVFISFSFS